MSEDEKNTVLDFLKKPRAGYHLLISGAYKTGKTSLAVAIANEWSIQHRTTKYATAMKLFSWMVEADAAEPSVPANIWTWRKADCLVIDDLNTGLPHSQELISPAEFMLHMNEGNYAAENQAALQQINTIWVLGEIASVSNQTLQNSWQQMLLNIGIPADKIVQVDLNRTA